MAVGICDRRHSCMDTEQPLSCVAGEVEEMTTVQPGSLEPQADTGRLSKFMEKSKLKSMCCAVRHDRSMRAD